MSNEQKVDKKLIREFREAKMLTQESLAEAAKVNPRTIQRMEGEGVASFRTITAVAKVLEVDSGELIFVSKWDRLNDSFMHSREESNVDAKEFETEVGILVFLIFVLIIAGFS